jgi:hypothetical protein
VRSNSQGFVVVGAIINKRINGVKKEEVLCINDPFLKRYTG